MSNDRRRLLRGAATALLAGATGLGARPAAAAAGTAEHHVDGGLGGIVRARYGFTGTGTAFGYDVIPLPRTVTVYVLPVTTQAFDESQGGRFALRGDGAVTVLASGFYDLTVNLDWPGQHDTDIALRKLFLRRVRADQAVPAYTPGGPLTPLPDDDKYDILAARDSPASNSPWFVRNSSLWAPGTIPVGGFASVQVALPAGTTRLVPGDGVTAGLTTLTNASLGNANAGLLLTARVVGPNVVRVWLENRYGSGPVTVPEGTLQLLGSTSLSVTGHSTDAWEYLNSPTVYLTAGEKILVCVRSDTPGDWVQISATSFLQVTAVA